MARYCRNPGAGGTGIFLVFRFGEAYCQLPETGSRPVSASELGERLHGTLTPAEGLIPVRVIDVARP